MPVRKVTGRWQWGTSAKVANIASNGNTTFTDRVRYNGLNIRAVYDPQIANN